MHKKIMDIILNKGRYRVRLISVLFTIMLAFTFLITPPKMSIAGDTNISEFLLSAGKIEPGYFFISPVLAIVLRFIGRIVPLNCWTLFSLAILLSGAYIILAFINKRLTQNNIKISLLVSFAFIAVFWELIARHDINFTQTTTIASVSGFLLIFDAVILDKELHQRKQLLYIAMGVALLILAGAIRWKALIFSFAFEAMILLYWYVAPISGEYFDELRLKEKKTVLGVIALIFGIIIASFLIHECYEMFDVQLKSYVENNSLRESIGDYKERYPVYNDNPQLYADLEIKESWIDMIYNFYTSDKNYFTTDKMKVMKSIEEPSKNTISDFWSSLSGKCFLWVLLLFFCIIIVTLNGYKNAIVPAVCCMLSFMMCAAFFTYIGRYEWRVTNGCILCEMIALYVMSLCRVWPASTIALNKKVIDTLCIAISVAAIGASIYSIKIVKKNLTCQYVGGVTKPTEAKLLDYINDRKNTVFLYKKGARFTTSHTVWMSHDPCYADNYIPLTSSFAFGCAKHLEEKYGITDLYNDLMRMNNVWIVYDSTTDVLLKYLQDFYDTNITITEMDTFEEATFIRYKKREFAADVQLDWPLIDCRMTNNDVIFKELFNDKLVLSINPTNTMKEKYIDYYVNIINITNGEVYTGGLNCLDENCVVGNILLKDDAFSVDNYTLELLGKDYDNNIIKICDIPPNCIEDKRY